MKISTKGRYGLRILLDLALHTGAQPRLLRDIAESQGISEKYLSRLIIGLRRAKLVQSVRGAKGGYRIARDPSQISVLEVVEIMEGPISVVECVEIKGYRHCDRVRYCAAREMWDGVNAALRKALEEVTLQSIIDRQKEMDSDLQCYNYCI